jgi:pyridoxal phosphate enzyme (YggS family)
MTKIAENINQIISNIPESVTLVAVSKTKPDSMVAEALQAGHLHFGENKAQALAERFENFKNHPEIKWHFIGHLQRNKVKYIAEKVHLIHSVDSEKLLKEINKRALENNRNINCLLQFHIAKEESKFGFDLNEAKQLLEGDSFKTFKNITICGVMGMATFTENVNIVEQEFKSLKEIFLELKSKYFSNKPEFKEVSMGMSGDYPIAIKHGATIIRIGSQIFGSRN